MLFQKNRKVRNDFRIFYPQLNIIKIYYKYWRCQEDTELLLSNMKTFYTSILILICFSRPSYAELLNILYELLSKCVWCSQLQKICSIRYSGWLSNFYLLALYTFNCLLNNENLRNESILSHNYDFICEKKNDLKLYRHNQRIFEHI